jgi:hypothetical protein
MLGSAVVLVSLRFVGEFHNQYVYYYLQLYKDGFGERSREILRERGPANIVLKP